MAGVPDNPYDPRLGPRSPREQAEMFERERRRDQGPAEEGEERDAQAALGLIVVGIASLFIGVVVAAKGAPVAGLYVTLGLFGSSALVVLVHPEFGTHPDVSRSTLVGLCTLVGTAAVGLLAHVFVGGLLSLPFALLVGAPLGAGVGWLLGTALMMFVRGLRQLFGR